MYGELYSCEGWPQKKDGGGRGNVVEESVIGTDTEMVMGVGAIVVAGDCESVFGRVVPGGTKGVSAGRDMVSVASHRRRQKLTQRLTMK